MAVKLFVTGPYPKDIIVANHSKIRLGLDKYIYPAMLAVLLNMDFTIF